MFSLLRGLLEKHVLVITGFFLLEKHVLVITGAAQEACSRYYGILSAREACSH